MTDLTAEELAERFHEAYERLAPDFGYRTREASAKPWAEVPEDNRRLMTAVAAEILAALGIATCGHCHDDPPAGHICPRCGATPKEQR